MRIWRRKGERVYFVSIEFAGNARGPYAHLATSPEIFRMTGTSKRAARRGAIAIWSEKYQLRPEAITKVRVVAPEDQSATESAAAQALIFYGIWISGLF